MKLFSFPAAAIEKAIAKRQLTLPSPHKEWFAHRKAFLDQKAVPLVTLLAKCKTWDDETFNTEMVAWDVRFHDAEAEVLRPLIQGDGLLQLMQKAVPAARAQALLDKLNQRAD
jgi:hypothetical protein